MTPEQSEAEIIRELRNKIFSDLAMTLPEREFEILRDLYVRYTTDMEQDAA